MSDEGQIRRLTGILEQTSATLDPAEEASVLFARGVRVLGPDEVILNRVDARLLDHVRMAAQRWEAAKKRAAGVSADSSDDTPGVKLPEQDADRMKEAQILAALIGAGKPLERTEAIRAAAGWQDYMQTDEEWEPWRAAWRRLAVQRRIQRTNRDRLGEFGLWKPVPVPIGGWHPVMVEFWERQRAYPGLCVALVPNGQSTMYGDICGKPEVGDSTGSCEEHQL